jgi:hypothetical protein
MRRAHRGQPGMALGTQTTIWINAMPTGKTTAKAIEYQTDHGTIWIPKACIGARNTARGRLEIARSIAEKKGFIRRGPR